MNNHVTSGQASKATCVSRDRCVLRWLVTRTHACAGEVGNTCSRSGITLALSCRGLHRVVANPVAGANAPHPLPRRP